MVPGFRLQSIVMLREVLMGSWYFGMNAVISILPAAIQHPQPSWALGSLCRQLQEVMPSEGNQCTCLRARWITHPMHLLLLSECGGSLGSLSALAGMSDFEMTQAW